MKHIILIHGRDVKPAERPMGALAKKAVIHGLTRAGKNAEAADVESGKIKFSLAYYGDISNQILAEKNDLVQQKLKDNDPDHGNGPCFPMEPINSAYDLTAARKTFSKDTYEKILDEAADYRYLDNAADAFSFFGSLLTGGVLNSIAIDVATADMGRYLTTHQTGSAIRQRLDSILRPALQNGDEICLLSHSMGCMVSYDVMWKYAHMSEYESLRSTGRKISLWLTFGNPLGELGVQRNLLDNSYVVGDAKYPAGQFTTWSNFYAQDDFVAHAEKMGPIYRNIKDRNGNAPKITDTQIYNCWTYRDSLTNKLISNPHDMYGYLMHNKLGTSLGNWINGNSD
jgi:hypothetical protein